MFNGGLIDPVGHPGVVGRQRSHDRPRLGGRAVPIRRVTRVNRPISFTMALRNLVDAIHPGIGGIFGAGLSTHPPMRARGTITHTQPFGRPLSDYSWRLTFAGMTRAGSSCSAERRTGENGEGADRR